MLCHQGDSVSSTTAAPLHGCSDELCASPITPWEAPPSASDLLISIAAPRPFISHVECSSLVRLSVFNAAAIVTQSSIVKLSFKATTPPKISLRFDIVLVICRNLSVTLHILVAVSTAQEFGFARFDCYYVTEAFPTHYAVSSIDDSSQSQIYGPLTLSLVVATNVQECGHASSSYYFTAALYYKCGLARPSRYYVTAATPTHYAVSSIDGSSQICLCDSLTGAASLYRGSRTSRSQNPLAGFFNVIFDLCAFFRTRALGIQVKFLYGFLISLATSIPRYVLVIFVYQFTVEDLSVCNELKLFDF
ncbi:hypothetical protein F2Q69_00028218 [Brassica cretica]|uniref:Uncharacterized protein n=1 Tax=Brassica cretica TaxID=69181 RepID=A0A8S9RUJ2_BRACR|nr:hypothetical protein F2Q69_00028218 [Brassica cretica]